MSPLTQVRVLCGVTYQLIAALRLCPRDYTALRTCTHECIEEQTTMTIQPRYNKSVTGPPRMAQLAVFAIPTRVHDTEGFTGCPNIHCISRALPPSQCLDERVLDTSKCGRCSRPYAETVSGVPSGIAAGRCQGCSHR